MKDRITSAVETLSSTEYRAKYDASAKRLFTERLFLAVILKHCIVEYKDCSLNEITDCIEGIPYNDEPLPVDRDMPRIKGSDTVDKTQDEGIRYFDIKFDSALPESEIKKIDKTNKQEGQSLTLIINLEPHGRYAPGYPILRRSGFYCARMVSDQQGKYFKGMDFGNIRKVYSIWLCTDAPQYCANTVSVYEITEKHLSGIGENEKIKDFHEPRSAYDIMTSVIVRIGDPNETNNLFVRFVGTLLSNKASVEEKIKIIAEIGIPINKRTERTVKEMSSLGAAIEIKAREEGIIQGRKQGRKEGRKEGQHSTAELMNFLWSHGRGEDAIRAGNDEDYLDQLLKDYAGGTLTAG